MHTSKIDVDGHYQQCIETGSVPADTVRLGPISFSPSQAWDGAKKTAISTIGNVFSLLGGGRIGLRPGAAEQLAPKNISQIVGATAFAAATTFVPGEPESAAFSAFGMKVTGAYEEFAVGRLGTGAEVAARITTSGDSTTVAVLAAYNAADKTFAGTLNAIAKGAEAAGKQAGSSKVTIQAVAVINKKLAAFLEKQGFHENHGSGGPRKS